MSPAVPGKGREPQSLRWALSSVPRDPPSSPFRASAQQHKAPSVPTPLPLTTRLLLRVPPPASCGASPQPPLTLLPAMPTLAHRTAPSHCLEAGQQLGAQPTDHFLHIISDTCRSLRPGGTEALRSQSPAIRRMRLGISLSPGFSFLPCGRRTVERILKVDDGKVLSLVPGA